MDGMKVRGVFSLEPIKRSMAFTDKDIVISSTNRHANTLKGKCAAHANANFFHHKQCETHILCHIRLLLKKS